MLRGRIAESAIRTHQQAVVEGLPIHAGSGLIIVIGASVRSEGLVWTELSSPVVPGGPFSSTRRTCDLGVEGIDAHNSTHFKSGATIWSARRLALGLTHVVGLVRRDPSQTGINRPQGECMPRVTQSMVNRVIDTISAISKSPDVIYYNIGITDNPRRRRAPYASLAPYYRHFAVLEVDLTANQALTLEQKAFEELQSDARRVSWKKYAPIRRDAPYRPSLGGRARENGASYFFYMAWRSE